MSLSSVVCDTMDQEVLKCRCKKVDGMNDAFNDIFILVVCEKYEKILNAC